MPRSTAVLACIDILGLQRFDPLRFRVANMQQIVFLALAFGSASAFVAPAAQAASSQLRSTPAEEIGVDPGPFGMTGAVPSGKFWEEQDGLARRRAVRGRVRINTANSRRLGRF